MKKVCLIFAILTLAACKDNKKQNNDNVDLPEEKIAEAINFLEHPYIFEKEGFKIEEFTYEELDKEGEYLFSVVVSGNVEKFVQDHQVFVHGTFNNSPKEYLINFAMKETKKVGDNKLVFYKVYKPNVYSVDTLRFGITNFKEKKRLFVLTLKNVIIS